MSKLKCMVHVNLTLEGYNVKSESYKMYPIGKLPHII